MKVMLLGYMFVDSMQENLNSPLEVQTLRRFIEQFSSQIEVFFQILVPVQDSSANGNA
jgi:hypothetical protein